MSIIFKRPTAPQIKWGKFFMFNIDFACNRDPGCPFCYNQLMDTSVGHTTDEIIQEVARQAEENKTKIMMISGGEPLASEMLFPTLEAMKDIPVETIVATNGDLITPAKMGDIYEAGCSHVALSISTMQEFDSCKDKLDILDHEGFTIGISSVHTKENHDYFLDMMGSLAQIPCISAITRQNICPHPDFYSILPSNEQCDEIAIGMFNLQSQHQNVTFRLARRPLDNIALIGLIDNLPLPVCGDNWVGGYTRILPNGDITNCVTYGEVLGNVLTDNIKEIGEDVDKIRTAITARCPYYQHIRTHYAGMLPGVIEDGN